MKEQSKLAVAALVLVLAQTGCGEKDKAAGDPGKSEHVRGAESGVSFNAKYGLLIPPTTAKFIGLEVADIAEGRVSAVLDFGAQVYRSALDVRITSVQGEGAPTAFASGWVSTAQAAWLRQGQPVTALIGADTLSGHLAAMNHDLEKANGQVEMLVAIADPQRRLQKGAFLSVSLRLGGEKSVVSIPRAALLRTTEGDFVYTVSGERFVRTAVKLGVVNHELAEVTEGLYEGDKVVVQPVMTLWLAELQSIRGGKTCADGH